LNIEMTDFGEF